MRLIAVFVYMVYVYGAAWVLVMGNVLPPEYVTIVVLSIGAGLIFLSILPPVRFLHSRVALFAIAGLAGFKRPDPAAKEELLSIWRQTVKFCGYDSARFHVVVYPSAPHAWPHVINNVLLLPDGFRQWARIPEGRAILAHEVGHLVKDSGYTFSWLFHNMYLLALLPIRLLQFIWMIAAHIPLVNFIAFPVTLALKCADDILTMGFTEAHRRAAWASEYRADHFAFECNLGRAMVNALVRGGHAQDIQGSFTHPPGTERIRRLQQATEKVVS